MIEILTSSFQGSSALTSLRGWEESSSIGSEYCVCFFVSAGSSACPSGKGESLGLSAKYSIGAPVCCVGGTVTVFLFCRLRRTTKKPKKAATRITPSAAPTPIPAFAPVLSPEESSVFPEESAVGEAAAPACAVPLEIYADPVVVALCVGFAAEDEAEYAKVFAAPEVLVRLNVPPTRVLVLL